MAGYTVIPNNLGLLGTWYVCTSRGTVNTSYPVNNLNDWHHWNQTKVASANVTGTHTVTLKWVQAGASSVADWAITGFGFVNGTIDGRNLAVISTTGDANDATDRSDGSGGATATAQASLGFDSDIGNPNALYAVSDFKAAYLYFRFTNGGVSFTLNLGNIVFGKAFDLGYPQRPESFSMTPVGGMRTETGLAITPRVVEPQVTKNLTFADPSYVTATTVYNRTGVSASTATYNNLFRHFAYSKALMHAGGYPTYTGITAGAGIPVLYHEGTNNGLSGGGRPAFYGVWNLSIDRNAYRSISPLRVSIVDAAPFGADVVPTSS